MVSETLWIISGECGKVIWYDDLQPFTTLIYSHEATLFPCAMFILIFTWKITEFICLNCQLKGQKYVKIK